MAMTRKESAVATLRQEMDAIHIANQLYWKSEGSESGREARAEYAFRHQRLEQIRSELLHLRSPQIRYIERKAS
jgi:hypothetical protein